MYLSYYNRSIPCLPIMDNSQVLKLGTTIKWFSHEQWQWLLRLKHMQLDKKIEAAIKD